MNKNVWYIAPIELYIIVQIRKIRLELGITAQEISLYLNKSSRYIGHMESSANNSKYSDEILSEIAVFFTKKAKELQSSFKESGDNTNIKTDYTIYDFYPKDILSDEKVVKEINPIPDGSGPTVTLNALIEFTDFFKKGRILKEIVDKCNEVQKENWQASDFTRPLERAVKGNSKRLEVILKDGLNTYILAKKQKKV